MGMEKWGAILLIVALSACAAGPAPRSGFLKDYDGLAKVGKSDSLLEQRPPADFDPMAYRAVAIDPTQIQIEGLSEEDKAQLSAAFHDALVERIGGQLPVVDAAGPGVLRVRTAIVSARKANIAVNVVTSLLATPLSRGGVAAEAEIIDGGTGKRIAALSWARRGAKLTQPGLSYTRLGEARAGLRVFAARLAALFVADPKAKR